MLPLRPPPILDRGPGFLQKAYNLLRKFCIEGQIYSVVVSKNTTTPELLRTARGQLLKLPPGGADISLFYPFKVTDGSTESDGLRVSVRYGAVYDFINDYLVPPGMNDLNDPLFYLACTSGDTVVYLEVTADTDLSSEDYGEILSVALGAANSLPANNYASGLFYLTLAGISVGDASVTVNQQSGGSMGFQLQGESGTFWSLGPAY